MISPSPTQQPLPPPIAKEIQTPPPLKTKRRVGETPLALFLKNLFRPLIKGIYYLIRFVRRHFVFALVALILLTLSSFMTSYLLTKETPYNVVGSDPFQLTVNGKMVAGGDKIKNWLYHLREGNMVALSLDQQNIKQALDPQELIDAFSQPKANLEWKAINVISSYSQPDTTVDTFVAIEYVSRGPGGDTKGVVIWHFFTIAQGSDSLLLGASLVNNRPTL